MQKVDNRNQYLDNESIEVREGMGKNVITPPEEESLWSRYIEKFKDPMIVILLVVFGFSVGVSLYEIAFANQSWTILIEPMGILSALLLATGVGFIFEVKAEREFKILNKKKDERMIKVLRYKGNGEDVSNKRRRPQMFLIKKCDVVVGDVVRLESGDEVPADGKLFKSDSLSVDESAFTGEMYAHKMVSSPDIEQKGAYPVDFLLRGSIVLEGQCLYRVTAIGMDTEEGKGAKIIQEDIPVQTPLNAQLDQLGNWITKASYVIAILIVIGRLAYYFWSGGELSSNGEILEFLGHVLNSIMLAVTLIVVAVPEGLPMSVTVSLALSMRKMLKENNLVRKLHACETMGATTVICTDKTGTLTQNKLRVMEDSVELYTDIDTVARCISINSTAELSNQSDNGHLRSIGNPTEGSLLYWLKRKCELDYQDYRDAVTITHQIAFSPETKCMTTFATDNESQRQYRYVKGAPEIILNMCDEVASGKSKEEVLNRLQEMQKIGRRTLAFAVQEVISNKSTPLIFIGFVGMADPIRPDVREAVETCHKAGVNIIMVTGDVALTAKEIAIETGIIQEKEDVTVITGAEFEAMSDKDIIENILPSLKVLSRARPQDKARLVGLLQECGQVVAVTGDGTNDAPALKKAQVGLSMGDGTSRAKEASDITIIDNSFASINTAILWGRSLYLNIKRFILFQMTINVCACLVVLIGAFMGLDSPLNVTQMLWVNLIMDTFAAMALSSLPPDSRVMQEAPRNPKSHIVDSQMVRRILIGGFLFFAFLFGLWQLLWHYDIQNVHDMTHKELWHEYFSDYLNFKSNKQHLSHYELGVFFSFFVLMQFWNLFNARYFRTNRSILQDVIDSIRHREHFGTHYSIGFMVILIVILAGQILLVNVFGEVVGVDALSWNDWLWLLILTSPILLVGDMARLISHALGQQRLNR